MIKLPPIVIQAAKALVDIAYPRYCACCKNRLSTNEMGFCPICILKMARYCEKTIGGRERLDSIYICTGLDSLFLFQKAGLVRSMIHDYKYHGNQLLGPILARMAVRKFKWQCDDYDLIVTIPVDPMRLMNRGFSQTDVLAQTISKETGIPFIKGLLSRRFNSHSQAKLSGHERAENVEQAFKIKKPQEIVGKRILLIDDILTTGSTLSTVGELLEYTGACSIRIFTLAVTE